MLMLPVTIGLGIVNLDQLHQLGASARSSRPRRRAAIDNAFRIYMLPQGMFSVAVATVLFPTLSRHGGAPATPTGCADRSATACARSTCC